MSQLSPDQRVQLLDLLDTFISGRDRSRPFAGQIEVALDESLGDDPRFEDIVLALASYEPGGGELLFDENAIVRQLEYARRILVAEHPA